MADQNFMDLASKTASGITGTDYMMLVNNSEAYKALVNDVAEAILGKLTSKSFSGLETTAKNVIGALNELNSKSNYLRGIPTITPELLSSDQTLIDYVANNYSSKSSVYFFGISSAVTSEQKNPFPGAGGFAILYNSSTTGYSSIYAFRHSAQIKNILCKNAIWESDWVELQ